MDQIEGGSAQAELVEATQDERATALRESVRGIPLASTVRGTLKRFLPASLLVLAPFSVLPIMRDPTPWVSVLGLIGTLNLSLTLGYGLGLEGLRRWLYPDAGVDGRRSVVAGLCTPIALGIVSIFTQGASRLEVTSYSVLAGVVMALLMFFAWLTPTPWESYESGTDLIPESSDSGVRGSVYP